MKVRTDFVWVADIGYAPPDVFANIPTFDYQGLRVIHPDYQRMDIHLAFCFPFNGPPREDVFHRWRKDLNRFNLFEEHYPIAADPANDRGPAPVIKGRLAVPVVGRGGDLKVALHGFAAYAVVRSALDELAASLGRPLPEVAAPRLAVTFPDNYTVTIESPAGDTVVFASPWPTEVLTGADRFSPYMDIYPESYRAGSIVVLSTKGRQLAASLVRIEQPAEQPAEQRQAFVVTPQYLMLWFLFEAQRADDASRHTFRAFYAHTLEIIHAAESVYADLLETADSPAGRTAVMDSFAASPFAPMLTTIGAFNHDAAYTIKMARIAQKLRDTPPAVLNLDANIADLLVGLPADYYPATSKQRPPTFVYENSPLFRRSGQKSGSAL
jgi:hypothetical protein